MRGTMQSFSQPVAAKGGALAGAIGGSAKPVAPGRAQPKADGQPLPAGAAQGVAQGPGGLQAVTDSKVKIASFADLYSGTEKKQVAPASLIGTASADGDAEADVQTEEEGAATPETAQDGTDMTAAEGEKAVIVPPKVVDKAPGDSGDKQIDRRKSVAAGPSGTPGASGPGAQDRFRVDGNAPFQAPPVTRAAGPIAAPSHSVPIEKHGAAGRPSFEMHETGQLNRSTAKEGPPTVGDISKPSVTTVVTEKEPLAKAGVEKTDRDNGVRAAPAEAMAEKGAFRSVRSAKVPVGDPVGDEPVSSRVPARDTARVPRTDGEVRPPVAPAAHPTTVSGVPGAMKPVASAVRGDVPATDGNRMPNPTPGKTSAASAPAAASAPVSGTAQPQVVAFTMGGQAGPDDRLARHADRAEQVTERATPAGTAPIRVGQPTGAVTGPQAMAAPAGVAAAQPAAQVKDMPTDMPIDVEEVALGLSNHGGSSGTVGEAHMAAQPHATGGSAVVRQIFPHAADLMNRQGERSVEIALEPAELGRVRMTVSMTDGGVTLQITAERPETLDLMRRHIEELSQELRRMGYTEVGRSFNTDDRPAADSQGLVQEGRDGVSEGGGGLETGATEQPAPQAPRGVSASGLDIRV